MVVGWLAGWLAWAGPCLHACSPDLSWLLRPHAAARPSASHPFHSPPAASSPAPGWPHLAAVQLLGGGPRAECDRSAAASWPAAGRRCQPHADCGGGVGAPHHAQHRPHLPVRVLGALAGVPGMWAGGQDELRWQRGNDLVWGCVARTAALKHVLLPMHLPAATLAYCLPPAFSPSAPHLQRGRLPGGPAEPWAAEPAGLAHPAARLVEPAAAAGAEAGGAVACRLNVPACARLVEGLSLVVVANRCGAV